jgi:hypothetical protein
MERKVSSLQKKALEQVLEEKTQRVLEMKPKKKRQRVWCKACPSEIAGFGFIGERIGNKIKASYSSGRPKMIPSKVKCPDCKKRFKPRVRECHDENCWHVYLPAHKKMV